MAGLDAPPTRCSRIVTVIEGQCTFYIFFTDSFSVTAVMGKSIASDLRKAEKRLRTSQTP